MDSTLKIFHSCSRRVTYCFHYNQTLLLPLEASQQHNSKPKLRLLYRSKCLLFNLKGSVGLKSLLLRTWKTKLAQWIDLQHQQHSFHIQTTCLLHLDLVSFAFTAKYYFINISALSITTQSQNKSHPSHKNDDSQRRWNSCLK